jgi:hypothetical protein
MTRHVVSNVLALSPSNANLPHGGIVDQYLWRAELARIVAKAAAISFPLSHWWNRQARPPVLSISLTKEVRYSSLRANTATV